MLAHPDTDGSDTDRSVPWGRPAALLAAAPEAIPAAIAVAAIVLVGLLDLHTLRWPLAYPLAAAAAAITVVGVVALRARTVAVERPGRWPAAWDLLALLAFLVSAVINARYSSQHVFDDRDPGTYVTTAQYLVHHVGLPVQLDGRPFAAGVLTTTSSYGATTGPTALYAQGMHGVPVLAAAVGRALGSAALLKTNAVLGAAGLLAFYAAARTVVSRGWAFLALVAVAGSLPQIHFSRDTYSETLGELAAWAGLALFVRARASRSWWPLVLAGLTFGAAMLSRTDSFLGIVGAAAMLVVLAFPTTEPRARRIARVAVLAAAVALPTVIGLRDLQRLSTGYYRDLHGDLESVFRLDVLAVFVALVTIAVVLLVPRTTDWYVRSSRWVALSGGGLTALVFAALAARPLLGTSHGVVNPLVAGIQARDHLTVDTTRTYAESTVSWTAYYLGPVTTVLGLLGLAGLVWWTLRRSAGSLPMLGVVLPVAVGYFIRPSISPDQIWAARRFMAIVIPGLALGAVLVLAALTSWVGSRRRISPIRIGAVAVAGLVGVATALVPLAISRPLLGVREYVPDLAAVQAMCRDFGPHSAVLGLDTTTSLSASQDLMPDVFAYCNLPVGYLVMPDRAMLAAQYATAHAAGRTLWVYSVSPTPLAVLVPLSVPAVPTLKSSVSQWIMRVNRAPQSATPEPFTLYLGRVAGDGTVSVVPGTGGLNTPVG